MDGHTAMVSCVCANNNAVISGSHDWTLKVWDPETGECLRTLTEHTGIVECVCAYNNNVISGSYDKTLKVWDPETGERVQTMAGHTRVVRCVCAYNNAVISGSADHTLKVWDPADEQQTCAFCLEERGTHGGLAVAVHSDNTGHLFCFDCISQCFAKDRHCPTCRELVVNIVAPVP